MSNAKGYASVSRSRTRRVTAVIQVGDAAWVNDGKLNLMRDPSQDRGQFLLYAVQLKK